MIRIKRDRFGALRSLLTIVLFASVLVALATSPVLASPPAKSQTTSFKGLGQMPGALTGAGGGTFTSGISSDGSTIVGDAYVALNSSKTEAYRWTVAGGYQLLGDLGSASSGSAPSAASSDGSVVVGEAPVGMNSFGAFRWTAAQGMVALPLPMIFADAVTADGTMVAGGNTWWKTSGQMGNFGSCGDAQISLAMVSLSADGSVAAGSGPSGGTPFAGDFFNAYRSTPTGNCQDIDAVRNRNSDAGGISADGLVIVGEMQVGGPYRAFRWTASSGMVDLGDLGGGLSRADAVNRDGSVIVGHSLTSGSTGSAHAFRWTAKTGMQDLQRLVNVPGGWTLMIADGVSADGTVITGYGLNPKGEYEPFRIVLPLP